MALISIKLPAGFHANGTELESAGRWRDGNLVRWQGTTLRPMRGSQLRKLTSSSAPRAMIAWQDDTQTRWIALGNYDGLRVLTASGTEYDITPAGFVSGNEDAALNIGYGGGFYGAATYGEPRQDAGQYAEADTWSLDTWGQYLVGCSTSDGKLYEWQVDTANAATQIANSPENCVGLLSTEERFIFALGADGDPRKIAWCDQEDNTIWAAASTDQAGEQILKTDGQVMCAVRSQGQALILTDVDAFRSTYVGPPYIHQFERVGSACGVVSRKAVAATDAGAFWMGQRGFFVYDGSRTQTIPCDVNDHVFNDINTAQASKVWAMSQGQHNEVWWFYPSSGSLTTDRYVVYNYATGHWLIGYMERTCGVDRGVFRQPLMANADGEVMNQEIGFSHYAVDVDPFIESAPYQIGGDSVTHLTSLIPDEQNVGDTTVTITTRLYPNGDEQTFGPYSMTSPTDLRVSGRDIKFRVDANVTDDWRIGVMRIDAVSGGRR